MREKVGDHHGDYAARYLAGHLVAAGETEKLFRLVEENDFLELQASQLGGFHQGSQDLEAYVVPAAIECAHRLGSEGEEEWPRFLRFMLVALNLRGLAEALADPEIFPALCRHGDERLALDVLDQLTDPPTRIKATALLLSETSQTSNSAVLLSRLEKDLDEMPVPEDSAKAENWLEMLCLVADLVGPLLEPRWRQWIDRLHRFDGARSKAWEAVVRSFLRARSGTREFLEGALREVGPNRLRELLPSLLADSWPWSRSVLEWLTESAWSQDPELLWRSRCALLGRQARAFGFCTIRQRFKKWFARGDLPWSVGIVEAGKELWPHLESNELRELAQTITSFPAAKPCEEVLVALQIVALEGRPVHDLRDSQVEGLDLLTVDAARLHWWLRYLTAQGSAPGCLLQSEVRAVGRCLTDIGFEVEAIELTRFLDLVANQLPDELERWTEKVVWSPATGPSHLMSLVRWSGSRRLLDLLIDNAHKYSAVVLENEREGFELRKEILIQAALRVACLWGAAEGIERAARALLAEEEDELRIRAVRVLTEPIAAKVLTPQPCRLALARSIGEGIRDRRARFWFHLWTGEAGEDLNHRLTPAALYRAMATAVAADDEMHALTVLQMAPEAPELLAEVHLSRVKNAERRIQALIDLANHAMEFQRQTLEYEFRDPVAALRPLTGGALDDLVGERRMLLLPQLAEMGGGVSAERAEVEFRKAFLHLTKESEISDACRLEAFDDLLARLISACSASEPDPEVFERCRRLISVLRWRLLAALDGTLREFETQGWDESALLSRLLVAASCLPAPGSLFLRYPFGARVLIEWLWPFSRKLDEDRLERWCRHLDSLVSWLRPNSWKRLSAALARGRAENENPSEVGEPTSEQTEWLEVGLELLEQGNFDPLAPRHSQLRRQLGVTVSEQVCRKLALTVVANLKSRGRRAAENALSLWFLAWIGHRPGQPSERGQKRLERLASAVKKSGSILRDDSMEH